MGLEIETWIRFFVWLIIGLFIYFNYSRHHSEFAAPKGKGSLPQNPGGGKRA
jgi:APA family basic amino acid/polyamine antiporter